MLNRERTIVVGGLLGGLLLGGLLLRGGVSSAKSEPAPITVQASPPSGAPPAAEPSEIDRLKEKIAELEKEQLQRRLAELEAETASDELADVPEAPAPSAPSARNLPAATKPLKHRTTVVAEADRSTDEVAASGAKPRTAKETPREKVSPGPATLAYWNSLNDIIARESAMRAPPANVTAANAGEFVQARLRAGRFASGAIRDLETTGVDADAVALGRELTAWYQEEVTLNERATSLMGSASVAERKGAGGNAWRSGEEQHRKKCDDINRHGAELRARLSRKYSLAFPPLN